MNEPLRPIGRLGKLKGLTEKGHILSEQHPDIRRRVVRCTTVQRRTNTGVDPTSILPADQSTSFTVGIPERRGLYLRAAAATDFIATQQEPAIKK